MVSAAQLEGADGLLVFELEKKLARGGGRSPFKKRRADGGALEESLGLENVLQGDHSVFEGAFSGRFLQGRLRSTS